MAGRIISGSRELIQLDMGLNAPRAAAALQSAGVESGAAIGLLLRNDFAFFEASLGARMIGAYPIKTVDTMTIVDVNGKKVGNSQPWQWTSVYFELPDHSLVAVDTEPATGFRPVGFFLYGLDSPGDRVLLSRRLGIFIAPE